MIMRQGDPAASPKDGTLSQKKSKAPQKAEPSPESWVRKDKKLPPEQLGKQASPPAPSRKSHTRRRRERFCLEELQAMNEVIPRLGTLGHQIGEGLMDRRPPAIKVGGVNPVLHTRRGRSTASVNEPGTSITSAQSP